MSYYPGDTHNFVLSLYHADGTSVTVTGDPVITIIRLSDGSSVVSGQAMTQLLSLKTYYYSWATTGAQVGEYVALVSYVADSTALPAGGTVTSLLLEKFILGDSRILGTVALDNTVAKDATVAKAATTLQAGSYVSPDASVTVLAIKSKTDLLPPDPAGLTNLADLIDNVQDLVDYNSGSWVIDKAANTLTILAPGGAQLLKFNLSDTSSQSTRIPA